MNVGAPFLTVASNQKQVGLSKELLECLGDPEFVRWDVEKGDGGIVQIVLKAATPPKDLRPWKRKADEIYKVTKYKTRGGGISTLSVAIRSRQLLGSGRYWIDKYRRGWAAFSPESRPKRVIRGMAA